MPLTIELDNDKLVDAVVSKLAERVLADPKWLYFVRDRLLNAAQDKYLELSAELSSMLSVEVHWTSS